MVIDHPYRLHKCIANRRADEFEAAPGQVLAHSLRLGSLGRYILVSLPPVLNRAIRYEAPQVRIEAAEFRLNVQTAPGIFDCSLDLEPVPDNTGISKQLLNPLLCKPRHSGRYKIGKGRSIVVSFFQDCFPAQSRLCALENQEFKEALVIVERNTPFVVMITNNGLGTGPV